MEREMEKSIVRVYCKVRPFLWIIFLQAGVSGMDMITKMALNGGMSSYTCVFYRHVFATVTITPFALLLERGRRRTFLKMGLLSLLGPVAGTNLFFLGLKYTTATFATAMTNVLPAVAFVLAVCFGLETVEWTNIRSQAKIIGTLATVAGALIMTLVTGPHINLAWTKHSYTHLAQTSQYLSIKGPIILGFGMLAMACFMIFQAVMHGEYPAELSLTAWTCILGTAGNAVLALIMERGNASAWSIKWDINLLAAVYGGVFCAGIAYYIQGVIMRERGPVFVTAFSPLNMIIVAIISSFVFKEQIFLGRLLGAIVIIIGFYLVIWVKQHDQIQNLHTAGDEEERGDPQNSKIFGDAEERGRKPVGELN